MNIFIFSHPDDSVISHKLCKHIELLKMGGKIESVRCGLLPGEHIEKDTEKALIGADLIISIISVNFLIDDIYLDLAYKFITKSFFVYGSSCDYASVEWLRYRNMHPNGTFAITNTDAWPDTDEPYNIIAQQIRRFYLEISDRKKLGITLLSDLIL